MDETRRELKRIWNGMLYHFSELASFMSKHGEDEYFNTDVGKKMKKRALMLMTEHVLGTMELGSSELFGNDCKDPEKVASDFEDLLKGSI